MIIDVHTHIFPRAMQNRRENYFDGEPTFKLLYSPPKSAIIGAQQLIRAMDAQGIDKSVVFGFPWRSLNFARQNNDYVIEAVNRYPDRLIGMCCLDPTDDGSVTETQRCLDAGLRGLGELAFYDQGLDRSVIERLKPHMDLCRQADHPLLLHTNEPIGYAYPGKAPMNLPQIYSFIKAFPKNKIILAHWGGGILFFHLLKKEVKDALQNVYFDTAASIYLYDERMWRAAVDVIGSQKILLGSDYPLLPPRRYIRQMQQVGLDAQAVADICGNNARRLFQLHG